mgnify:CR=1 FL=1
MAVPAHDERDFVFAKTFGLKIKAVVKPEHNVWREQYSLVKKEMPQAIQTPQEELIWQKKLDEEYFSFIERMNNGEVCWTHSGFAMNSDSLNDSPTWKAKDDMISWLEEKDF